MKMDRNSSISEIDDYLTEMENKIRKAIVLSVQEIKVPFELDIGRIDIELFESSKLGVDYKTYLVGDVKIKTSWNRI